MSLFQLALASLKHNRRINLAVMLGVVTATAVLTGALLVGDSVRGSLRSLVLGRLGEVDYLLVTQNFFRAELVDDLLAPDVNRSQIDAVAGAILAEGSLKSSVKGNVVSGVTVIGCQSSFWKLGIGGPEHAPQRGQIVLNSRVASQEYLDVKVGDKIVLQIGQPDTIPADSPLGRKTETVLRRTFTVSEIIPADGLGGFSLSPSQQLPANAFVALESLQSMLDARGELNMILVSSVEGSERTGDVLAEVKPELADYGLRFEEVVDRTDLPADTRYFDLTARRMLLDPVVLTAAAESFSTRSQQPVFTYLANWISTGDRKIPYSTIAAVDSTADIGPLLDDAGQPIVLADDEIVLNDWAANDLEAEPGDEITITYFDPETTHGQVRERTAKFRLKAIVPLGGDQRPPTMANDARLTPELKGVTDQESIDDWDPPFPFDATRVRDRDEDYWDRYRATPKAFVSLTTGRRLWSSRFGDTTSVRVVPSDAQFANTLEALRDQLADTGLIRFQPIRQQALQAASGTTPFGLLFLGFSMFLIAAALMLIVLLFRLGVEERAGEIGLLLAVGFSHRRVFQVLLIESLLVVNAGALVGVAAGIGYASLMIAGLNSWWLEAVTTPFLELHVMFWSLVIGYLCGAIVSTAVIAWSLWRWRHISARRLMTGEGDSYQSVRSSRRWRLWAGGSGLILAGLLVPAALGLQAEMQAGMFFLAGGLALFSGLVCLSGYLRSLGSRTSSSGVLGLVPLATRNIARKPQASILTMGLVATATFLLVAISAFRLDNVESGGGGYDLVASTSAPLYFDPGTAAGRLELNVQDKDELLEETNILSLRVHGGDDASCLNLYRPRQPRLLGVPENMPDDFQWAGKPAWGELNKQIDGGNRPTEVVPVVLDQNTAMYSLRLMGGIGEQFEIEDASGQPVRLEVVGLLKNSIFQGDILMAEPQLLRLFPDTGGYKYFLVKAPANSDAVGQLLEQQLADYGFDSVPVRQRMEALFAVQNTYLSTFQSLGGLGLLLGMFGLAAVQIRNVFARRGELAVMRVTGFRRSRLAELVILENVVMLVCGLGIGVGAALLAVIPHFFISSATVPWESLAVTLGLVLFLGLAAGLWAVHATVQAPLIAALRGE